MSHYLVKLPDCIADSATTHCRITLPGQAARSHCQITLPGHTETSHCHVTLPGPTATSQCRVTPSVALSGYTTGLRERTARLQSQATSPHHTTFSYCNSCCCRTSLRHTTGYTARSNRQVTLTLIPPMTKPPSITARLQEHSSL